MEYQRYVRTRLPYYGSRSATTTVHQRYSIYQIRVAIRVSFLHKHDSYAYEYNTTVAVRLQDV